MFRIIKQVCLTPVAGLNLLRENVSDSQNFSSEFFLVNSVLRFFFFLFCVDCVDLKQIMGKADCSRWDLLCGFKTKHGQSDKVLLFLFATS